IVSTITPSSSENVLSTSSPAPRTPPASDDPLLCSRVVTLLWIWYLSLSLPSSELWFCSSLTYVGTFWIRAVVWAVSGGIAVARKMPITAATPNSTTTTAAQRGHPRRVSQLTTGSRPTAMNSASPTTIRTALDRRNSSTRPKVTATPNAPVIPIQNGDRRFTLRPGSPIPLAERAAISWGAPPASWTRLSASSVAVPGWLASPAASLPRSAASCRASSGLADGASLVRASPVRVLPRSGSIALIGPQPTRKSPLAGPPAGSLPSPAGLAGSSAVGFPSGAVLSADWPSGCPEDPLSESPWDIMPDTAWRIARHPAPLGTFSDAY